MDKEHEDKWSKIVTQWYSEEGKRKKGRPQKRWEDGLPPVAVRYRKINSRPEVRANAHAHDERRTRDRSGVAIAEPPAPRAKLGYTALNRSLALY
ncbi:hypothetical protein EVAR_60429_1 [Eumeta japonica]|uniref:Uncharacterized protein n=1 Tax=Eumeta variegata TaxID=151549 RepID=A0A4C1ZRI0_EUMVA|nr:hypothetical protein EVAR_60429_1 [Eumeta japonica]